ncbi:hypothetical protein DFA_05552 [Cavenderia fasciculata]|uniref:Uncharacterized protein n=1 Tax=Cavenderia fasciculata TaxID=261658 RepID=F4PLJ8_CACFS|nr:uncharacterized protein DFA_05552 [Cavenderia fasciculata]EGG23420.1 hypothetical protein DFA_05552 [Cavenderia fasciculata]|eukprot:XP_004361271.1 hypothetical protein DFA_05552 [Cavenderia fasciculata]
MQSYTPTTSGRRKNTVTFQKPTTSLAPGVDFPKTSFYF